MAYIRKCDFSFWKIQIGEAPQFARNETSQSQVVSIVPCQSKWLEGLHLERSMCTQQTTLANWSDFLNGYWPFTALQHNILESYCPLSFHCSRVFLPAFFTFICKNTQDSLPQGSANEPFGMNNWRRKCIPSCAWLVLARVRSVS